MTLEQLRVFVAVAERQHVTRAAEALNIAQSAVSASIAARAVLARAELAELVLSELGGLKRGGLSVHASQTIAGYWLPRHLVAFHRAYPGVAIRLSIGNTAQAAAAVRGGEADLGFVEGEVDDPVLISEPIARDQLVIVVGPEHPWGEQKGLIKDDLMEVDLVLREPGSGTRAGFEHSLEGLGLSPHELRVALELPSNEAVRAAVESGMGATAVSSVAAPGLEAGLLRQADFMLPVRSFYALRHAERYRSRAAETLMDIVRAARPTVGVKS